MDTMTHKERFLGALNRQPVDLLACGDGLWGETSKKYVAQGKLKEGEDHCAHFDMSWRNGGWLNSSADLDFQPVTVEETDETILKLDGNGAKLALLEEQVRHARARRLHRQGPRQLGTTHQAPPRQARPPAHPVRRLPRGTRQAGRRREPRLLLGRRRSLRADAPGVRPRVHADGHGPRPGLGQGHGHDLRRLHHHAPGGAVRRGRPARRHLVLRGHGLQGEAVHVAGHVRRDHAARPQAAVRLRPRPRAEGHRPLLRLRRAARARPDRGPAWTACRPWRSRPAWTCPARPREFGDRISFCGDIDIRIVATNDRSRSTRN